MYVHLIVLRFMANLKVEKEHFPVLSACAEWQTYTVYDKFVGTAELHYSTIKWEHSFSILKASFVRHSSEFETSGNDRKAN